MGNECFGNTVYKDPGNLNINYPSNHRKKRGHEMPP